MDDTSLAMLNDPARRAAIGEGADTDHLRYITAVQQRCWRAKPAGMTICTHLCRGNFRSAWLAEGSYEHVAEAMFSQLDVDGFFLEYDDARSGRLRAAALRAEGPHGGARPRHHQEARAGSRRTISSAASTPAAKYVPLDQLCLSPQCGFASTAEGNLLTVDDQIAKLRLVVETAREVWG